MSNTDRVFSLDVFRGLTMALMVIVNSTGTLNSYPILGHSSWHGCSLADLVFPSFLFIVGMTTAISLNKYKEKKSEAYLIILKRTVLLFFIGIVLNIFPKFDLSTLRVYGILQRIAVCYFACAMLYLFVSVRTLVFIFLGLLISYWYVLTQVPMPGIGVDQLSMTRNWVGYVDNLIFSPKHLLDKFDPEGLLSTSSAVATSILGLITGIFLLTPEPKFKKCKVMGFMGCIFILSAWIWSYSFPINKNLWTSTFVLWSGGISFWVLGACFFIIDFLGYTKWAYPFKILGMSALFIFVFHVVLLKIQYMFVLTLPDGSRGSLRAYFSEHLLNYINPQNADLLYALFFLLVNFLLALFLYKRNLFIRL